MKLRSIAATLVVLFIGTFAMAAKHPNPEDTVTVTVISYLNNERDRYFWDGPKMPLIRINQTIPRMEVRITDVPGIVTVESHNFFSPRFLEPGSILTGWFNKKHTQLKVKGFNSSKKKWEIINLKVIGRSGE